MLFTRPDAKRCTDVNPSRAIMPFLMPTRTESTVQFEQELDLTKTQAFVDRWNEAHPEQRITVFHVFLSALAWSFEEWPRLNRFVSGGRLWQRDGVYVSFAAKKKKANGSPLVVVKRRVDTVKSFTELVSLTHADVKAGRSEKKSSQDKELDLLTMLPAFLLGLVVKLVRLADRWNLLPRKFVDHDPLFTSIFVANLGSVGLESAYHHLYEYGNCPFFAALGRSKTVLTPEGPKLVCSVKYTFDERIEDGLYCAHALESVKARVENPETMAEVEPRLAEAA
ncbi:MAG: hypothetical protein JNJ54_10840 [Myxococcaceae bacterium]|nr:hypothetical protein [Myxococcaceae bacterium]